MKRLTWVLTSFLVATYSWSARAEEPVTAVAPEKATKQIEGYVIGTPQYVQAENVWRFKFAPKRNKQLEGYYLMVSIPAKSRTKAPYYLGDYVKMKTQYDIIKPGQTAESNRAVANDPRKGT